MVCGGRPVLEIHPDRISLRVLSYRCLKGARHLGRLPGSASRELPIPAEYKGLDTPIDVDTYCFTRHTGRPLPPLQGRDPPHQEGGSS